MWIRRKKAEEEILYIEIKIYWSVSELQRKTESKIFSTAFVKIRPKSPQYTQRLTLGEIHLCRNVNLYPTHIHASHIHIAHTAFIFTHQYTHYSNIHPSVYTLKSYSLISTLYRYVFSLVYTVQWYRLISIHIAVIFPYEYSQYSDSFSLKYTLQSCPFISIHTTVISTDPYTHYSHIYSSV